MHGCVYVVAPNAVGMYRGLWPAQAVANTGGFSYEWIEVEGEWELNYELGWPPPHAQVYHLQRQIGTRWHDWKRPGRMVYDIDDLVTSQQSRRKLAGKRAADLSSWLQVKAMMRIADLVTVSTPYLADYYRPYCKRVEVVRNRLWWPMWQHLAPPKEKERITIGWMGIARARHGLDLPMLASVLPRLFERHPELDFWGAGSPDLGIELGLPPERCNGGGPTDFVEYLPRIFSQIDIGLVPIHDTAYNHAKSHLKGLEYGAAWVPHVAGRLPEYERWSAESGCGLASTPKEWTRELERLLEPGARIEAAHAVRKAAEANRIDRHAGEWRDVWQVS